MRLALQSKRQHRQQISRVVSYPPPVGGWNARDALANMKPTDAVRLVNWFPRTTDVVIRGGDAAHFTGMDGDACTLAVYNALSGHSQMFAATETGVWDASTTSSLAENNYLNLPGASGDYASTPDSAAASITGDIDLRTQVAFDVFPPSGDESLISKFVTSGDQRSYRIYVNSSGIVGFQSSSAGTLGTLVSEGSTVALSVSAGDSIWIRATLDVDNGAGGHDVKFYTSTDYDPDAVTGTWTQLGATVTGAGTTSIFDSTADVEIGSVNGGTNPTDGKIYRAQILNGIAGSIVADFDPNDATAGDPTVVSSHTGETYTLQGNASIQTPLATSAVTNGRFQWVNFGDGTNNYLIMVNGVDKPLYYNGTTWVSVDAASSPALTGITTTLLVQVMVYQGRLFFIPIDSLSFWYLAAGAAGGALTEFDLSSIARMGGYLVAMTTWTFDGGDGPDDYAVFVTSEGEIIIYRGTNPSSASTWTLVGKYFLGKPLGRRCFVNYGGDVVLITQNGAFPLSAAMQSASIDRRLALTDKIENAFNEASRSYGANFGWEATLYPAQGALVFNIPTAEVTTAEQYVMNTITKAWCRFTAWNANCFGVFNGELYFGAGDSVYKAWTGTADGEDEIISEAKQAFSYFGANTQQKRFTLFQPILQTNGPISFLTGLDVDFKDENILGEATYAVTGGALWDEALWDVGMWAASLAIVKTWTSPQENVGYAAAGKLKINTDALTVSWMASNFVFEQGGIL